MTTSLLGVSRIFLLYSEKQGNREPYLILVGPSLFLSRRALIPIRSHLCKFTLPKFKTNFMTSICQADLLTSPSSSAQQRLWHKCHEYWGVACYLYVPVIPGLTSQKSYGPTFATPKKLNFQIRSLTDEARTAIDQAIKRTSPPFPLTNYTRETGSSVHERDTQCTSMWLLPCNRSNSRFTRCRSQKVCFIQCPRGSWAPIRSTSPSTPV